MNTFFETIFRFNDTETPGQALHFKILELYMVYHAIWTVWYWGRYTLRISDVVLPLGIAQYIDITFMYGNMLPLYNAALISALLVLAFFRLVPSYSYMIALILMHIQYVARYTLGEISHGAHLTAMTLLIFALGVWFFRDSTQQRKFIFGSAFFYVGISYMAAGVSKLIGTGPWWIDGHHLWIWMSEKSIDILSREGVFAYNWLQELAWISRPIATLILLSGLFIELFGVGLWFQKTRWMSTTLIIGMHIGIMMTMNIRFDASIAQMLVMGYAWSWLFDRYLFRGTSAGHRVLTVVNRFS